MLAARFIRFYFHFSIINFYFLQFLLFLNLSIFMVAENKFCYQRSALFNTIQSGV